MLIIWFQIMIFLTSLVSSLVSCQL